MRIEMVEEEIKPTGDGARSERQDRRTLLELDADVAERVMGWHQLFIPPDNHYLGWFDAEEALQKNVECWEPSVEIADAMEVITWLCPSMDEYNAGRKSCRFIMRQQDSGLWSVEARCPFLTSYDTPVFADSRSLPEAICRAALALVDGPLNQETK